MSSPQRHKPVRSRVVPAKRSSSAPQKVAVGRQLPRHTPLGVQLARPMGRDSLRRQRRVAAGIRVMLGLFAMAGVVGGAAYISHIDRFEVHGVTVHGTRMLSASTISAVVDNELSGNMAGIFSKRSILWYPKDNIRAQLVEKFPTLTSVDIRTTGVAGTELVVAVAERAPYALWCADDSKSSCFAMDAQGFIFATAFQADAANKGYLTFRGGLSSTTDPIGETLLGAEFPHLVAALDALKSVVPDPETVRLEGESVTVVFPGGMEVRFSVARAAEGEVLAANLRAALEAEVLAGRLHSQIEYIDLRFENRLYYKLR